MDKNRLKSVVKAAISGEAEAYAILYEMTYEEKYAIALRFMKNRDDAMDVVQDSYVKAWLHIGELDNPEKFSIWLSHIVVNTAKDALKRKKPLLLEDIKHETEEGWVYKLEVSDIDEVNQPELIAIGKAVRDELLTLLKKLPKEQRICMALYYICELSSREIAQILNCSEATVRSRMMYARNRLRKDEDWKKFYEGLIE